MKQIQKGFTLIELIVVIVILGILAATAMPKFLNLSDDARIAAVQGVAGAITSGGNINYGQRLVNSAKGVATSGVDCATAAPQMLEDGTDLSKYTVTGTVPNCTITDNALAAATASAVIPAI